MRTAAQEAERTEGEEDPDGTETAAENYYNEEDIVVNTTLETNPNTPLAYDPGLEIHQLIMNELRENGCK